MTDMNTFYYKFGKGDETTEITGVVDDVCSYGIDQVDICTVNVLSSNRTDLKRALKNQYFEKIRNVDDEVEFRGQIVEISFAHEDKYNLTFKVKSPVDKLNRLTSHVLAEWLKSPTTLTAVETGEVHYLTSSEDFDEPAGYVEGSTAAMIVHGEDPVFVEDNVTEINAYSAGASQTGVVGNLNDDDPDTGVKLTKNNTTELYQIIRGPSSNPRGSVVAMSCDVTVRVRFNYSMDVKLQYYDWDAPGWVDLGDTIPIPQAIFVGWKEITFKGRVLSNVMVRDDETTEFKIKLLVEGTQSFHGLKICMSEIIFYSDVAYDGTFFPITEYHSPMVKDVTVSVNPVDAGVDVGDTFLIGWKDSIILAEIFDEYSAKKYLPFNVDIGTLNNAYTAYNFKFMSLMSCLEFFMDKQQAHYWFDHLNNTLYIRTETVMTSAGANRALDDTYVESYSHDDKESTAVSNIVFHGGSYRRGDGEEIKVEYKYPDIWDGSWSGVGTRTLVIDKSNIKNWTEARNYCENIYASLNSTKMSMNIKLAAYNKDIVVSNKVDLEIDGLTLVDEPVVGVTTSYNVADDLAIKTIQVGWQQTSLWERFTNFLNELTTKVSDLIQTKLQEYAQDHHALLRVDGIIDALNITFDQVTIKNQGAGGNIVMTSDNEAAVLDLAAAVLANASLDNAVISEANVSQHEAALAVKGSLLSDSVPDNKIDESSVAQHQAALAVKGSLLTDPVPDGAVESSSVVQHQGDITGLGVLTELKIEEQILTQLENGLQLSGTYPIFILKDKNDTGVNAIGHFVITDDEGTHMGALTLLENDVYLESHFGNVVLNGINVLFNANGLKLAAGAQVNDIDTAMEGAPTDSQLLTAQGIKEFINAGVLANILYSTTDPDHKIVLDAGNNSMHFYAGDNAANKYMRLLSSANTDVYPVLVPQATDEGQLGASTTYWKRCYANTYLAGGNTGKTGTFEDNNGNTVTVTGGIITDLGV